jgi:hypothetical protein
MMMFEIVFEKGWAGIRRLSSTSTGTVAFTTMLLVLFPTTNEA